MKGKIMDMSQSNKKIRVIGNIESVLQEAIKDLNAESGSLMIVDSRSDELFIKAYYSQIPDKGLTSDIVNKTRIKIGQSISGFVAKTQKPLLINDIKDILSLHPNISKNTNSRKYRTSIVIPVINKNNRTTAVLNINNKLNSQLFSQKDFNFAILLAEYCGAVLKLERKNIELMTVNEIIREINKTNDLNIIFKMIVNKGKELLFCRNVSIMIIENDFLIVKESTNKRIIGQKRKFGVGVSGWVWKTGEPIFIKKLDESKKDTRFQLLNKPGSFIVAPLNLKYETPFALNVALKGAATIGVLNFSDKIDGSSFDDEDLDVVINYANLTAIAIEKVRFFVETKKAYLSTVEALSSAIDINDKDSYEHLRRVVKYSLLIAKSIDLSAIEKENLHFAALLHDIGKIGIAEHILSKSSELTPDEYEKMKKHVEKGVKILANVPFLYNAALIVKHHHERFDGEGYPDRLKGEKIPIGARILTITDSFDAMTSDRIYKSKKTRKEAIKELRRCAGSQFDPKLTKIFLEILEKQGQT
ncbi:MAG: HD domain-containing phosphohydrolase [Candidatus Firestonebacteria bacterium]